MQEINLSLDRILQKSLVISSTSIETLEYELIEELVQEREYALRLLESMSEEEKRDCSITVKEILQYDPIIIQKATMLKEQARDKLQMFSKSQLQKNAYDDHISDSYFFDQKK